MRKGKGKLIKLFEDKYGEYMKGFFIINLNYKLAGRPFKFDDLSGEECATFVHEYIHFLQNVTTTHGINYFNNNSKFIQLFVSESYKFDKYIPTPFREGRSSVENALEEFERRQFYKGDDENIKINHVKDVKIEAEELLEEVGLGELNSVCIYYDDKSNPYRFGALCVEESMAYLIENQKFGGQFRENELPYNACELICEKIFPEIVGRKDLIVAIAEIALMHYDSGIMFADLIKQLKGSDTKFLDTNQLVDFLKDKVSYLYNKFDFETQETSSAIDFLYPQNSEFGIVNHWIKKVFSNMYDYRKECLNLISKCMDLPEDKCKDYINGMINVFGLPAVFDNEYNMVGLEANMCLALVPIAIFNIFKGRNKKCYLYEYCKASNIPTINEKCISEPWCQSKNDRLCPFALFWSIYSLEDKEIICDG